MHELYCKCFSYTGFKGENLTARHSAYTELSTVESNLARAVYEREREREPPIHTLNIACAGCCRYIREHLVL